MILYGRESWLFEQKSLYGLQYRSGFYVGRYISLEAKIAENKDLYYEALGKAQEGWHEGKEDVVLFIKYLLETILAACKDFEDRFEIIEEKPLEGFYYENKQIVKTKWILDDTTFSKDELKKNFKELKELLNNNNN